MTSGRPIPLEMEGFLASLGKYASTDAESRSFQGRIRTLIESAGVRAFDRNAFEPGHVTGSAFIVDPAGRRVLLHHHRRLGKWLQMGGHAEGETDPAQTALREGTEESGLFDLQFLKAEILDLDIHLIPVRGTEPSHEHFDVRYALTTGSPDRVAPQEDESEEIGWFAFGEAIQKMGEPGAARAISRLEAWLKGNGA